VDFLHRGQLGSELYADDDHEEKLTAENIEKADHPVVIDVAGFDPVSDPGVVRQVLNNSLVLDHERLTYRYAGRDFRLTDVHGEVVQDILA
jgi:hypothetical protein